jgi:hypothetical protein
MIPLTLSFLSLQLIQATCILLPGARERGAPSDVRFLRLLCCMVTLNAKNLIEATH